MRLLLSIEDKMARGEGLSEEEKIFLWLSRDIDEFGYTKDKRADELRLQRNMADDSSPVLKAV